MLTIFALKKLGNSNLAGCEGFFNLDSPNAGGLFECNHSFSWCSNAVFSFQKEFVATFGICDQGNYRRCSKYLSKDGEAGAFARESYWCGWWLRAELSPFSCFVLHQSLQKCGQFWQAICTSWLRRSWEEQGSLLCIPQASLFTRPTCWATSGYQKSVPASVLSFWVAGIIKDFFTTVIIQNQTNSKTKPATTTNKNKQTKQQQSRLL